jgi:pterin-4a-carbinolamine dehydratase
MNNETMLYRQVHPTMIEKGKVTSQVFRPTPKDKKQLSAYDGDQITAENSWQHFTNTLSFVSVGVVGVTVEECQHHHLVIIPDPKTFREHVLIDFTSHDTENQIKKTSKLLRSVADNRGWLYKI